MIKLSLMRFSLMGIALSGVYLAACSTKPDSGEVSETVKVRLPWLNSQGNYESQVVEIKTLTNIRYIRGQRANFFYSPQMSGNHLEGVPPMIETMVTSDGVYIPKNSFSAQMLSLYAHIEKLVDLDQSLGVTQIEPKTEFRSETKTEPLNVGVSVLMRSYSNSLDYNNALYYGPFNALLVVPYTLEGLPLAVNGGVLAHEYFHSLFHRMVLLNAPEENLQGKSQEKSEEKSEKEFSEKLGAPNVSLEKRRKDLTNFTLQRAYNEGIADFWGYMYTGDPSFIDKSLAQDGVGREVTGKLHRFYSRNEMDLAVRLYDDEQKLTGFAYRVGTDFSRFLKRWSDLRVEAGADRNEANKFVAKNIVAMLPGLRGQLLHSRSTGEVLETNHFIEVMMGKLQLGQTECDLVKFVYTGNSPTIGNCTITRPAAGAPPVATTPSALLSQGGLQ